MELLYWTKLLGLFFDSHLVNTILKETKFFQSIPEWRIQKLCQLLEVNLMEKLFCIGIPE
jgi:hypothetical protein